MDSTQPAQASLADDTRGMVLLLAGAAFFSGVALRICDGLLPRLASDFSITAGTAGQVVLAFSVAYSLMQLLSGPLGDRFGKANMVALALAACSVMSAVASLMPHFELLLLVRIGWGMAAAGIIPLAMAWIGDNVPYAQRQAVLARLLLGTLSGLTAGQLAGGLFGDAEAGWRGAFLSLALGYTLIAGLLLWRLSRLSRWAQSPLPESAATAELQPAPSTAEAVVLAPVAISAKSPGESGLARARRQTLAILATPWNRLVLWATFFEGLFLLGPLAFVPTMLHREFALSLSAASGLIAFYALGGLVYAMLARRLILALGERRMVLIGGLLMGSGMAAWWLSPLAWTAAPVAFLVGFGTYLYHNTLQVLATQMAPESRGTAVSLFSFSFFFGQAMGVTGAGWAFDHLGGGVMLSASVVALPLVAWRFSRALALRPSSAG